MKILPEELVSQMLKNFTNIYIVLRANPEQRQLKLFRESFCLLLRNCSIINEVDLSLDQNHCNFAALFVNCVFPFLDVLERFSVYC